MAKEKDELHMQTADIEGIKCRTCKFRDMTSITIGKDSIAVGVTRDTCAVYTGADGNFKPHPVIFRNADCSYYSQDE